MKIKKMLFLAVITAVFFVVNMSYAQVSDEKKECSKTCTKTCDTKMGDSQGIVSDSLKTCPVSGEKIDGSEGEPVKFTYLGKEYTFCCSGCVKKFKSEPMNYIKDEVVCVVMGEPVDKNVSTTYEGVKYYFCCNPCIKKFEKEPQKYLNKQ